MGIHDRLTTVVSTKGQVILPKGLRDRRHWPPGTRLTVEETPDGVLLKASPTFAETRLDRVFGTLRHAGPPLSDEDMSETIAREARNRARD